MNKNRPRCWNTGSGHGGSKLATAYCPPIITRNMEELQCQENQIPERRKGPEASGSGQTAHGKPALSWGMIPALESRSESPFTERPKSLAKAGTGCGSLFG